MSARSREARKNRTIQRIRIVLLVAVVATVGWVVALLLRERTEQQQGRPTEPDPSGALEQADEDMVTVGEGFERTASEGDRALFTVRGEKYAVDEDRVVYLDGVEIIIYSEDDTTYTVESPEATFEQERREARLSGGVTLTGPDGLLLETEAIEVLQRGRQVVSAGEVYFRLGERLHGRGDRLRVLLRARRYHLIGHARIASLEGAERPFVVTAQRLTVDRTRHLVEADEGPVRLEHSEDWLLADRMVVFLDEAEERAQYVRAGEWVVAELRSGAALERTDGVETTAEEATAGDGGKAESAQKPTGTDPPPGPGGLSWVRMHTASLDMELTSDGRHPREVHLEGGPGGRARLRAFAAGGGPVHRLDAPRIDGRFMKGRPHRFEAEEDVDLAVIDDPEAVDEAVEAELEAWRAVLFRGRDRAEAPLPEARAERRARGRRAEATFDSAGQLETVTLIDDVVIIDRERRAEGMRGVFRVADDAAEVTGHPATVVTPRVEMEAPTVVYTRSEGLLHGAGGVRARMERTGETTLDGTPLAEGDGPVWVEAEQGFFREDPRTFLFTGSVRAWRGRNLLTGSRLRGDDAEQRLTASGDVRTLWIAAEEAAAGADETPGDGDADAGDPGDGTGEGAAAFGEGPIEVTGDEMVYRPRDRVLVYTGDVVSEQGGRILACRELEMTLAPEGAESGRLEKLVCTGDVRMSDPGTESKGRRTLSGHRAVYDPRERTVDVTAAPEGQVVMEDREGNVLQGPRMIYEIEQDRVRVLPLADEAEETPEEDAPGEDAPDDAAEERAR